ncbi:MAG: hypothetical protein QXI11_05755 [Thermoproteota archaeon]
MTLLSRMGKISAMLTILLIMLLQVFITNVYAQKVEVYPGSGAAQIVFYDASDKEIASMNFHYSGAIENVNMQNRLVARFIEFFVWMNEWDQRWATVIGEPTIEEKPKSVKIIGAKSQFKMHPFDIVTNVTVTNTGLLIFDGVLIATGTSSETQCTAFLLKMVAEEFDKAIFKEGDEIKECTIPSFKEADTIYTASKTVYWVDLVAVDGSFGIIMIDLNPRTHKGGFLIEDWRPDPYARTPVQWRHVAWGTLPNPGEVRRSTVAVFFHGPGDYRNYINIVNPLSELGIVRSEAEEAVEIFTVPDAKSLAQQALDKAKQALAMLMETGNVQDIQPLVEQAKSLLDQARAVEGGTPPTPTPTPAATPTPTPTPAPGAPIEIIVVAVIMIIIIIVVVLLLILIRRKKSA